MSAFFENESSKNLTSDKGLGYSNVGAEIWDHFIVP